MRRLQEHTKARSPRHQRSYVFTVGWCQTNKLDNVKAYECYERPYQLYWLCIRKYIKYTVFVNNGFESIIYQLEKMYDFTTSVCKYMPEHTIDKIHERFYI